MECVKGLSVRYRPEPLVFRLIGGHFRHVVRAVLCVFLFLIRAQVEFTRIDIAPIILRNMYGPPLIRKLPSSVKNRPR